LSGVAIDLDVKGLDDLARAFDHAPDLMIEEYTKATWQAELLLEREIKELTPTGATSVLRESIIAEKPVLSRNLLGVVGTSVAHALPVELGTKPHFPPIEPLMDWVRGKLDIQDDGTARVYYVALAIARKIAARGTLGVGMFHRSFAANRRQMERMFEQANVRFLDRFGEH
jgi:hypothetical protein